MYLNNMKQALNICFIHIKYAENRNKHVEQGMEEGVGTTEKEKGII